jgi:hypothetical protein
MKRLKTTDIIGLKVYGLKSLETGKCRGVDIILFDDRKTFLKLEEQDYYTFHDCSSSARIIYLNRDPVAWERHSKLLDANDEYFWS